jgi:GTP 3',8-cyclase
MIQLPNLPVLSDKSSSPIPSGNTLIDTFGRIHNNLRISVTDRCNLRCTYCMPEDVVFRDKSELLTFEEIAYFVEIASKLGIDKIRLTGGEPLMRRDLHKLVDMLLPIPGIRDVSLTTNAILLDQHAQELYDSGLRRLNVSLDTLDPERFQILTRRPGVEKVISSLITAKRVGFEKIKINAVSIRGFTELDAVPLARFAQEHGFELRFIEYMPIGADHWEREKVFFAHEILELLEREFGPIDPSPDRDPNAPSMDFVSRDHSLKIGIIASVSRPFCGSCNRIRLTAEGKLRNCLFALDEVDVRPLLRNEKNDPLLTELIRRNVWSKWEGHEINTSRFVKPDRTMHAIGG